MAIQTNDNFFNKSPKADNDKTGVFEGGVWRPYNDITEAVESDKLVPAYRSLGLTVTILKDGVNTEYWFRDGIEDEDLIEKLPEIPEVPAPYIPDYDPAETYNTDNVVVFGDNKDIYRATEDGVEGVSPDTINPWVLTSETIPPTYNVGTTYNTDDYAIFDTGGGVVVLKSLQDGNIGHPYPNASWWVVDSIYYEEYNNVTIYEKYFGVYNPSVSYENNLYTANLNGAETVTGIAPDNVSVWEKLSTIAVQNGLRIDNGILNLGVNSAYGETDFITGALVNETTLIKYATTIGDTNNASVINIKNDYIDMGLAYHDSGSNNFRGGKLHIGDQPGLGDIVGLYKKKYNNSLAANSVMLHYPYGDGSYTTQLFNTLSPSGVTNPYGLFGLRLVEDVTATGVRGETAFLETGSSYVKLFNYASNGDRQVTIGTSGVGGSNEILIKNNANGISDPALNLIRITTHSSQYGRGMEYQHDYSANFTARSLVDKGYVDTKATTDLANYQLRSEKDQNNGYIGLGNARQFKASLWSNITNQNNGYISILDSGPSIVRNIADNNPALLVHNNNPSSTGGIADFFSDSSIRARIYKDGRMFGATGINSNEFTTKGYVDAAVSGVPIGSYQLLSEKGAANGYAQLDSGAKIPLSIIPDSILGQVEYQGTWNATTNSPTLVSPPASTTKGHYYITSVAGTQFGIDFEIGDWIISDGTAWGKVDNSDAVMTVFGRLGNVVANTGDYTTLQVTEDTNLYFTQARARTSISETITGIDYDNTTGIFSLASGYVIPTTTQETNWTAGYNDKINSLGFSSGTLTLTQQDGGTLTQSLDGRYALLSGDTFTGDLKISGVNGSTRNTYYQTSGSNRWRIYASGASESGSNVGSDLLISNYTDAGTLIGTAFSIQRSNGRVQVANTLTVGTTTVLAQQTIIPQADATKGLVIRGFSPTQSAPLQEWQDSSGSLNAFMTNGGTIGANALVNGSSPSNSTISPSNNGTVISRNIADTNPALIVNSILGTGYVQSWQQNSVGLAAIDSDGIFRAVGLSNFSSNNIANITMGSSGTIISRNITGSPAGHALRVNLKHASATGDIAQFQAADVVMASINKAGKFTTADDIEITTDTKGIIMKDITLATRHRITLDNGVLVVSAAL